MACGQMTLNTSRKRLEGPRMIALVDQVRNNHMKGQLEALGGRSGAFEQDDVGVKPPPPRSVRPAATHILLDQCSKSIPHR
eukprot:2773877-Rhodomonas_salina.1